MGPWLRWLGGRFQIRRCPKSKGPGSVYDRGLGWIRPSWARRLCLDSPNQVSQEPGRRKRMEKKKTSLGLPTSASPGQKGTCHSESCGETFSDKGLSQGQGQPAEREVEPESPVPGQAETASGAGARLRGTGIDASSSLSLGLCHHPLPALGSLSGSFPAGLHFCSSSCLRLPAPPLPQPVCLCPWPSLCLALAISHRHGPQVFLKLSVPPQS